MRITHSYFWALKCSDLQTISISFGLLKIVLCSMKAELSLHCVCMSASPHTNRHACCLVVFWHMFEKVPARVTSAQTHTHTHLHTGFDRGPGMDPPLTGGSGVPQGSITNHIALRERERAGAARSPSWASALSHSVCVCEGRRRRMVDQMTQATLRIQWMKWGRSADLWIEYGVSTVWHLHYMTC